MSEKKKATGQISQAAPPTIAAKKQPLAQDVRNLKQELKERAVELRLARQALRQAQAASRQAEEDLELQRLLLEAVSANARGAVFSVDRQYRYTSFNAQHAEVMKSLFGVEIQIGQPLAKFGPVELVRARLACLQKVVETGQVVETEDERAGMIFHHTYYPVKVASGSVVNIVSYSTDITERKRMEGELGRQNQKINEILSNIQDDFYVLDRDWNFVYTNRQFPAHIGKEPGDFVGKNIWELFPKHIGTVFEKNLRAAMEERELRRFEVGGKYTDAWYIMTVFPSAEGITVLGSDITVHKRAEAEAQRLLGAVQEEKERLSALVSNISDEVWFADSKGKFTLANPAALREFGIEPGSAIDIEKFAANLEVFRPDGSLRPINEAPPLRALQGEFMKNIEEIVRIPTSGELRNREVSATPVRDVSGSIIGAVSVVRDITERKKSEQTLVQLNRTLRALSNTSQAMLRAADEKEFLENACKIIIEDCGHAMVWVGYRAFDEGKSVQPMASAGFEQGFLETLKISWADNKRGRGPTGTAVRTGRTCHCRNILTDPQFTPWRLDALKRGYASLIAVPLMAGEEAFGVLTIYSRQPDGFSAEEEGLLNELAGDMAFGIETLTLRAAQARAVAALQESEQRYRSLFNSMTEGFALHEIICDEQGQPVDWRFLDINPAFERLTGLKRAEVVGKTHNEVLPGDSPEWLKVYGKVALTGEPVNFDNYSPALQRHYEVFSYRPMPGQFAVNFMDVTERKRMEENLRESEQRFRLALTHAPVTIATQDRDLRFQWAYNQRTVDPNSVIGKTDADLFPPEDAARLVGLKRRVLETEKEVSEQLWVNSGGQRRFLDLFIEPLRDAGGQVTGIGIATVDLTQTNQIEEELRQSEETAQKQAAELETIFATLTDSVIVYGPGGVATRMNSAARALLGFDLKHNLASADTRDKTHLSATAQALQGKIVKDSEFDYTGPDGERRTISAASSPLRDAQGQITGAVTISRDITERKKQSETQAWLASFPQLNPTPVVELAFDGSVSYLNPAARRLFPDLQAGGLQHPFLAGLEPIIKSFKRGKKQEIIRDVQIGESVYQQTITCVSDSQRVRVYSTNISGRVKAEAALRQARDELEKRVQERTKELLAANKRLQKEIAEKLRAETALRESESRYRTLFETSPDTIMLVNLEQKILFANQQAARMHGYRHTKNLIGVKFAELIVPEDREAVGQSIAKTLEKGTLREIEYQILKKDGAHFPAELNVTTICDEGNQPVSFLLDIRDITERKWAEESLRKAFAYNRNLIEASLDPLVTITPEGKIGDVNQAAEKVTGYASKELIGTDFHGYFSDPEGARAVYRQAFETGNARGYELEIRHRDGHVTPVLYNASVYRDENGQALGVFALAHDITDRKEFETRLVQAEKHAVIGRMVGSITHEINNPLQTIKNSLYLMQQDITPDSPIHEPLEMVTSETARLTNLVGQLRELYRPKAGMDKQSQELLDILEEAHSLLTPHLNNARVEWHPMAGLQRCYINCVRDQVLEVFLNISMNAIEAMHAHGGSLFVDMHVSEEWAAVVFKDTGPGIPNEIMEHLFEPFMTTKASGLGLGLSIIYGIVQRHGGQIQVDNQPGQGATFTVLLPLKLYDGGEEEVKDGSK